MIQIPDHLLEEVFAHGKQSYPEEACGLISGPKERTNDLTQIHPMENKMSELHAQNPKQFPRTNHNAYYIDDRALMKLKKSLKKADQQIRVIYHTHPDVGAYFSETDQNDAMWGENPRYPGVTYLVCGITQGEKDGAITAFFDQEAKHFTITRIR